MKLCIGTKLIMATAMTRQEYNDYRGWELPANECGDDKGYLVEYVGSTTSNHENHEGYISWSPESDFPYTSVTEGMSFGHAIEMAKLGNKIARKGWNGKNMFVAYMPALYLPPADTKEPGPRVNERTSKFIGTDKPLDCQPYFAMYNAQEQWIPGWLASQSDMLATDWYVISPVLK